MKIKPSELGEGIFIFSARKTIQISLQANSLLDAELAVAEIQEDQSLWDVEPEFSLLSWGKSI